VQRTWMIFATALLTSIGFAGMAAYSSAHAQMEMCRGIADSDARLACYKKNSPASLPEPKATGAKAEKIMTPDEILAAENAKLDAKTKNICRGC
jgi:hypothetical protein